MPVQTYGCEYLSELMQAITSASRRTQYPWQLTEVVTIQENQRQRRFRARPVRVVYGEETRIFFLGRGILYESDQAGGYRLVKLVKLSPLWRKLLLRNLRGL